MLGTLASLTEQLAHERLPGDVVGWASPVPHFGEVARARVATVGINPSNLEFVDAAGRALVGKARRLETLSSLGLAGWGEADGHTVRALARSCSRYFAVNPYRRWFDVLERVISVSGHSYYRGSLAAHLDLVPFATETKWGMLPPLIKRLLILRGRTALAETIASSRIELLVLNGRSVVDAFIASTGSALTPAQIPHLSLPRKDGKAVVGVKWEGTISRIADHDLGRVIKVVGFNHNLQSSFGVTNSVMQGIGEEVEKAIA